jgi:predicted amidohydrolase
MKTIRLVLLLSFSAAVAAAVTPSSNLLPDPSLRPNSERPEGWVLWSPRPGLAPLATAETRAGEPVLMLQARHFEDYGRWSSIVRGIEPGRYYRFDALHQAHGIKAEAISVSALLFWCRGTDGTDELQTDYVNADATGGDWRRHTRTVRAPEGARSVRVELGLRWTDQGAVAWKGMSLSLASAPAPRIVRVATTRIMPGPVRTIENNKKLMVEMLERTAVEKPDIVLLSENLIDRATRLPLAKKAETVPGPLTELLGEQARKHHCYVITTLHERDGDLYYNTAVLIDREGRLAGKYRKVHLAISEGDDGLTPGSDYPVFDTDFGRIGILTCWDNWFAEPARILRLRGAEILFYPLAGDGSDAHFDAVSRARAMDNGLFFVSSGTVSDSSRIINPNGEVVAEARGYSAYTVQDLDLNQEWRLRYLSVGSGTGEAKSLYFTERRSETYSDLTDGAKTPPMSPVNR